ncbi:MAG: hypothetical protein H7331_02525 [Bacteroidia bacterium]|nr:hypothetical protein [Bacteroidia bacterium]
MKILIKIITCAVLTVCVSITTKAQTMPVAKDSLCIYLYRGSFNDALPEFEIKIYKNGMVNYKGIKNTTRQFEMQVNIDAEEIDLYFIIANAMPFFNLQKSYTENFFAVEKSIIEMTDYSTSKTKKVMRRGKIPKALLALEDRIIITVEKAVDEAVAKQK